MLEELDRKITKRVDVEGIFPNRNSVARLVGMVLVGQNEEWQAERCYLRTAAMVFQEEIDGGYPARDGDGLAVGGTGAAAGIRSIDLRR